MRIKDTHEIQAGRARLMRACKSGDQRAIDQAYAGLNKAKVDALLKEADRLRGLAYASEHDEGPGVETGAMTSTLPGASTSDRKDA